MRFVWHEPVTEVSDLFTNNKWYVTISTVEDLIKELELLPPKLPVKQGNDGVDMVLFNRGSQEMYVGFDNGGEWPE